VGFVCLVAIAIVLYYAGSRLKARPLAQVELRERAAGDPPTPTFPIPRVPQEDGEAPLIKPTGVALPSLPSLKLAFGSRDPRVRELFLERNGGDARSEAAVAAGLRWLAKNQSDDGSWSSEAHGGRQQFTLGVTGLALLAFLGAGHTHLDEGPYKETVAKAIQYILREQNDRGYFSGPLYHQGICTMAIVEAYGMTGDTTLEPPSRRAIEAIVAAQNESGGWDYHPGGYRGDTSVTGWQVMALKSARRVGIEFDDEVLKRARDFLISITREDGAIGYDNRKDQWRTNAALTAAGLNAHLFAGAEPDDEWVQKAVGVLLRNLPVLPRRAGEKRWNPPARIYLWYHGSLALNRLGGFEWRVWNSRTKPLIIKLQSARGEAAGRWDTYSDRWGSHGGRIYFTALCILALEVYYRYD